MTSTDSYLPNEKLNFQFERDENQCSLQNKSSYVQIIISKMYSVEGEKDYMKAFEAQRLAFEQQFGSLENMGFKDMTMQVEKSEDKEQSQKSDKTDIRTDNSVSDKSKPITDNTGMYAENKIICPPQRRSRVIKFNGPPDNYIPTSKKNQRVSKENGISDKDKNADCKLERENLQNDIKLQRFLEESHLLSALGPSGNQRSGAELTLKTMDNIEYKNEIINSKARLRTLEMRLREISKTNGKCSALEKVPIQIRKGMIKKHIDRIRNYEQDAKDAGIVLSTVKKGQFRKINATFKKDIERRIGTSIKAHDRVREQAHHRKRGFKIHSVGKSTRNGLVISKKEIAQVNGTNFKNQKHRK